MAVESQPHLLEMPILLLLLLVVAAAAAHLILPAIAEGQEQPRITRPGCPDKCGNMSIPFPFGMDKPGCFLPGFEVTCNTSFHPPRAFLAFNGETEHGHVTKQAMVEGYYNGSNIKAHRTSNSPVELIDISVVNGEARVFGAITSLCNTDDTMRVLKGQLTFLGSNGLFLSPARNVLVGVGWNVETSMHSDLWTYFADEYKLTCLSNLMGSAGLQYATNGSCAGRGCCQAALPSEAANISDYGAFFRFGNNTLWERNPCSYSMVVEDSWYNFSTPDLYGNEVLSNRFPRGVPVVLGFGIKNNSSCPAQGQKAPPDYACVSDNSYCTNVPYHGHGYVCHCSEHYQGNPYITDGCQDIDECEIRKQSPELSRLYPCSGICKNRLEGYDCTCKPGTKGDAIAGTCVEKLPLAAKVTVGLAALIVVSVLMVMTHQLLKLKRFYEQNGGPLLEGVKNIRIYTSKQMKQITNNYKHVIGEGHFGKVYMGILKDKQQVAIKRSIKVDNDMKKEFTDEVIIQSEMRHKNIVRLLGCCLQMEVPMLVYEFVARGSLYDVLFRSRDSVPVDTRLRIAIGSAEGLTYMHSAGESTIRHGDVKSANILIDEKFTPKVSDFGTSKLLARGTDQKTERVIGDKSYIDPIYMEKGIVTQKSDVYSFGIVLIELITRRAATYDDKRSYVANFVQASRDKRAREFVDNDITGEKDIKLLEMVSEVAVECLKHNPDERLDMKQVEHRLVYIIGQSPQYG